MKLDKFIFLGVLLLFGGFYDWNIAFIGIFICLYVLLLYCGKQDCYKKERRWYLWIPETVFVFQVLVSFWAVDKSANIAGIIRGIVILLWMHICLQWDQNVREQLLCMIPDMGVFLVILGGIAFFFEKTRSFFWMAERFGGFFQYANTCALFLFLGIIICSSKLEINKTCISLKKLWIEIGKTAILLLGILFTGSRSIIIIAILWGIFRSVFSKKFRKVFVCVTTVTGVILGIYYVLTGEGTQNISRIFTIIKSNSTLYGRLLYDLDGFSILYQHPMGLGYLGYHYVQHTLQTGVYTVRFVHNDILQMGLDYGIIPMLLFIFYIAWQFIKGKQPKWEKEILAVIIVASTVDFHMQYMIIDFIIILCLDLGITSIRQKKVEKLENSIAFSVFLLGFVLCLIPYFAIYKGNYQMALKFMPSNTEAMRMVMLNTEEKNIAVAYADRILKHNLYVADAYNVKAYAAAMDGDIESVLENQDEILKLEKYDLGRYQSYDLLLEQLKLQYQEMGQEQTVEQLEKKRVDIKEQLNVLREQTNAIAYMLRDAPKYTW